MTKAWHPDAKAPVTYRHAIVLQIRRYKRGFLLDAMKRLYQKVLFSTRAKTLPPGTIMTNAGQIVIYLVTMPRLD